MDEKEVQKDLDKYSSLDALRDSDGGKLLISLFEKDVLNGIESIIGAYKSSSHIELISLIAKLEAKLVVIKALKRAKSQKDLVKGILENIGKENE